MSSSDVNNPYLIETELLEMKVEVHAYYVNNRIVKKTIMPLEVFRKRMEEKYEYLLKASPGLFEKCFTDELHDKKNMKRVEEMLYHLKNIYGGKVSKDAVDKHLGEKYAKEYVDPLVNKLNNTK